VEIEIDCAPVLQQRRKATGVIVVAMAHHKGIHLRKVHAKRDRVSFEGFTFAGIEQDLTIPLRYQYGEAVLCHEPFAGGVVDENFDLNGSFAHVRSFAIPMPLLQFSSTLVQFASSSIRCRDSY